MNIFCPYCGLKDSILKSKERSRLPIQGYRCNLYKRHIGTIFTKKRIIGRNVLYNQKFKKFFN